MTADIRCIAQSTAVGATLYRLSDGRYWLDAVLVAQQGFLSAARGSTLAVHLHPHPDYGSEPLDTVLAIYQANTGRPVDEMTGDFPDPFTLQLFPSDPPLTI